MKRKKPTPVSKICKTPRSSPLARKLLWQRYARTKSWQAVREHFGLRSLGETYDMAVGKRPDSPTMRRAVKAAQARARRAFFGANGKTTLRDRDRTHRMMLLIRNLCEQLAALESELTGEAVGI